MHLKATKHVTASAVAQQTNDFKRIKLCVNASRRFVSAWQIKLTKLSILKT